MLTYFAAEQELNLAGRARLPVVPISSRDEQRADTAQLLPSLRYEYARNLLPVRGSALWLLVGLLQIATGFVERAPGVVIGLNGLTIFARRTFTLSGKIENLSQLDVTPDLCPARLAIPVQAVAIRVRRSLVIVLQEKHLGDAIVGQRTVVIGVKRLLIFLQRLC